MKIIPRRKRVDVILNEKEWAIAFRDARRRQNDGIMAGRGRAVSLGNNIYAAASELAVAGVTGRKWQGHLGEGHQDVEGLEVKFTGNTSNGLIIREKNNDGIYVLVTGTVRQLTIVGWYDFVSVNETMQKAEWVNPRNAIDEAQMLYVIPTSDLRSIFELEKPFVNPDQSTG